jgi:hypothetical protein
VDGDGDTRAQERKRLRGEARIQVPRGEPRAPARDGQDRDVERRESSSAEQVGVAAK